MRVAAVMFLVLVVACNGESTATTEAATSTSATASSVATTAPAPPPAFEEVSVELSDQGHLVDEEGMSLYVFTLDTERTSSCEGECAQAWPPLLGDPTAGDGVDQSLLGNAERGNGAIQVTYAGQPLYRYESDGAPGDTNGHGFNDLWFLVGPNGEPLER